MTEQQVNVRMIIRNRKACTALVHARWDLEELLEDQPWNEDVKSALKNVKRAIRGMVPIEVRRAIEESK